MAARKKRSVNKPDLFAATPAKVPKAQPPPGVPKDATVAEMVVNALNRHELYQLFNSMLQSPSFSKAFHCSHAKDEAKALAVRLGIIAHARNALTDAQIDALPGLETTRCWVLAMAHQGKGYIQITCPVPIKNAVV